MIPKHAQQILDELLKLNYEPKGMDRALIHSIKKSIANDRLLSKGQADWLQDIYRRATGGGDYQQRERF